MEKGVVKHCAYTTLNNVVKNAMIAHGYGQAIHVCCMCKHYTQASTNLYSWVQNLNQAKLGPGLGQQS